MEWCYLGQDFLLVDLRGKNLRIRVGVGVSPENDQSTGHFQGFFFYNLQKKPQ